MPVFPHVLSMFQVLSSLRKIATAARCVQPAGWLRTLNLALARAVSLRRGSGRSTTTHRRKRLRWTPCERKHLNKNICGTACATGWARSEPAGNGPLNSTLNGPSVGPTLTGAGRAPGVICLHCPDHSPFWAVPGVDRRELSALRGRRKGL